MRRALLDFAELLAFLVYLAISSLVIAGILIVRGMYELIKSATSHR